MRDRSTIRRVGYALAAVHGVVAALAPGTSTEATARLLGLSYEGTDGLTARPWYRRQVRATGVGLLAAGLAGLALEGQAADETDATEAGGDADDG